MSPIGEQDGPQSELEEPSVEEELADVLNDLILEQQERTEQQECCLEMPEDGDVESMDAYDAPNDHGSRENIKIDQTRKNAVPKVMAEQPATAKVSYQKN